MSQFMSYGEFVWVEPILNELDEFTHTSNVDKR